MTQPDPTKPPGAGPGGEPSTSGQVATSSNGWRFLSHQLTSTMPHSLRNTNLAVRGIHTLIRTGR